MREAALSLPEGHFAVGGRVYKRAEGGEGVSPRPSALSTMSEEARRLLSSDNLPEPTGADPANSPNMRRLCSYGGRV